MSRVVFETERLMMRRPSVEDVDALAVHWGDPETMKYIGQAGDAWPREKVVDRINAAIERCDQHGMTFWTAVEKETNCIVGQGGLVPIEFNGSEVELGYRLGKAHWGKGYATEIAIASAAYGFESLGLNRLIAVTYPENTGSRKVLTKTGFREVGESDLYYDCKTVLYELSKESFVGNGS